MDYLAHNIAINLGRIRKAKGMSLDVVAEQTGVSKSMLATIEDLTQAPSKDAYLVDVANLAPTKDVPGEYRVWTCFPIADNHIVEIYRIDIEPGGTYWSGGHGERTKEYLFVLAGALSIELAGGKSYDVAAGQSFRFSCEEAHTYRNLGDAMLKFTTFFVVHFVALPPLRGG
ncbi:helix-turn-helix domain-containing protein [uncultured Selenomonas sp.]|uniref:helix-turn-helix domain-containing protein n=1 Tax=uncultured Selenomonas sp. TaxID=159275 RepID=UPI0025EBF3D7|nr:XRE family transcriptional regulator [uncultured Selenomonas sp.]